MKRPRLELTLRLLVACVLAILFAIAIAPYLDAIPDNPRIAAPVLIGYLGLLVPYHGFRAIRWHTLVRPLGSSDWRTSMLVALAGYMWVALLPFRLGELARPLFLGQRTTIPAARAFGSIAVERIADGFAVCTCFFVGLAFIDEPLTGTPLVNGTLVVISLFAAALVGLIAVAALPPRWQRQLEERLARVVPKARLLHGTIEQLVAGLRALATVRTLAAFIALTACYWLANAVGMWFLARGTGLELSASQSLMVLAVMNIALLLPGGPAQFGIFQTGLVLGLALFVPTGLIEARGSVFAFYLYLSQIGSISALGWWAQHRLRLRWQDLFVKRTDAST